MSVLVIAEHDNKSVKSATFNTIAAAAALSDDIDVLVAGQQISTVVESLSTTEKVKNVIHVDAAHYEHQLAEDVSQLIAALGDKYSHILMPATTTGKNILPRAAALLDVQPISDVIEIVDTDTFKRPIYAGNVIATVKSRDAIKMMTVRATAFDPVATSNGTASQEAGTAMQHSQLSSFINEELAQSDRPELTAASVVISGGRGMQNGDNFELLYQLADKLGAAVGASRAAVDAGFVPNDMQVGQTGKIVAPDLYIAVGISGAIQHLAGMKDSKIIVAINKDEEAPIFQVADYGLVADLFDAVPALNALL